MQIGIDDLVRASTTHTITGGNETILLVDDEEQVLDMSCEILEILGYTVIARSNGLDAYRSFVESPQRFDVIITDQVMPHMTGIELARRVRELDETTPIILCSGFSLDISARHIADYGLGAVLTKPLRVHEIDAAIRRVVD